MHATTSTTVVALAAWVALAADPAPVQAERPSHLTVAIHAPTLGFGQASERLAFAQTVADAIEARTGIKTLARAYARYSDLTASRADFAIIDGLCIAARAPGPVLATAVIDGGTSRDWGVFGRESTSIQTMRGRKIAFAATGCRDLDFVDNVVLGGEVKTARFFAGTVTKADVLGAVAAVKDYKEADLVVAPRAQAGSLALVLGAGSLPNPGLVQLVRGLDAAVVTDVTGAVTGLPGWRAPVSYAALGGRLGASRRQLVIATVEPERLDLQQMASPPRGAHAITPVRALLWTPAAPVR